MKLSYIHILMSIAIFLLLTYCTFILFPFIITASSYENSENVSSFFPIAIIDEDTPRIIRWPVYLEHPESYNRLLLTKVDKEKYPLENSEFFVLKKMDNKYKLSVYRDDYTFWSEYKIDDGFVQPLYFRYTGAFVVFYCLIVACIGTPVLGILCKRYLTRYLNPATPDSNTKEGA